MANKKVKVRGELKDVDVADDRVLMKAPSGATSISVGDDEYVVDDDGFVTVPSDAIEACLSHSYTFVED